MDEPTKSNIQTGHPIKPCHNTTLQASEDHKIGNEQPDNSTMGKEVLDQNRRTYDFVEGHNHQPMDKSTANQIIENDLLWQVSLIKTELKKLLSNWKTKRRTTNTE